MMLTPKMNIILVSPAETGFSDADTVKDSAVCGTSAEDRSDFAVSAVWPCEQADSSPADTAPIKTTYFIGFFRFIIDPHFLPGLPSVFRYTGRNILSFIPCSITQPNHVINPVMQFTEGGKKAEANVPPPFYISHPTATQYIKSPHPPAPFLSPPADIAPHLPSLPDGNSTFPGRGPS